MAIFVCPSCSHTEDAPNEHVGRTVRCVKCGSAGTIFEKKAQPPERKSAPTAPKEEPPQRPRAVTKQNDSAIEEWHVYAILLLLAALLASQVFGFAKTQSATTEWEYKIQSVSDSTLGRTLDSLGEKGWELVFARRAVTDNEYGHSRACYEMIFQRPKKGD